MAKRIKHLDAYLADWPFVPGQMSVREVKGADGRPLLQLRVDMGIIQMETTGRPDGARPEGFDTYYDFLLAQSFAEGTDFNLDAERCLEIDREYYQYYHRRICWLMLRRYAEAVRDADHTLGFMDFCAAYSPDPQWTMLHEQYRPLVMFHRLQAKALVELERSDPREAIAVLDRGLEKLKDLYDVQSALDSFEEEETIQKLREMRSSIVNQYELGPTLAEQLAQAIQKEQYELAAQLRDRINQGSR